MAVVVEEEITIPTALAHMEEEVVVEAEEDMAIVALRRLQADMGQAVEAVCPVDLGGWVDCPVVQE